MKELTQKLNQKNHRPPPTVGDPRYYIMKIVESKKFSIVTSPLNMPPVVDGEAAHDSRQPNCSKALMKKNFDEKVFSKNKAIVIAYAKGGEDMKYIASVIIITMMTNMLRERVANNKRRIIMMEHELYTRL